MCRKIKYIFDPDLKWKSLLIKIFHKNTWAPPFVALKPIQSKPIITSSIWIKTREKKLYSRTSDFFVWFVVVAPPSRFFFFSIMWLWSELRTVQRCQVASSLFLALPSWHSYYHLSMLPLFCLAPHVNFTRAKRDQLKLVNIKTGPFLYLRRRFSHKYVA